MQLDPDRVVARPLYAADGDGMFSIAALEPLRLTREQHASDDEIIVCDEAKFGALRRVAFVDPYWHATTGFVYEVEFDVVAAPPLLVRFEAGWPLPALGGVQRLAGFDEPTREVEYDRDWLMGVRLAGDAERRSMPLRPLWPGFAVNSILYAAASWLLLFAPIAFRRALRRRRGMCERCAYPRGSSDICSECGLPLSAHPERTRTP